MQIGIYKTNIRFKKHLKAVAHVFQQHPSINDWHVDQEDIDNVLRVELTGHLSEEDVVKIVRQIGLECEKLN